MANYRLLDRIGSGGMGSVYRGLQLGLNREVALKLLATGQSEEALARFRREATILASLGHPHIVRVLDHGELDGSPFLAMEMVEGRSLESFKGSPMPLEQALPILVDLADALAHLAAHGIVHRDVKPQNVMIDRQGAVRLVDFGVSHDPNRTPITSAGQVLGTPMYLAPEAMIGKPATTAVDVWCLALIAHELISGEQWCAEKRRDELFRRILKGPAPVLAGVPGWFAELQARALRTDPGARPPAAEYRDALLRGAGPSTVRAPAPPRAPSRPVPKPSRSLPPPAARRGAPLGVMLAAVVAAIALIAVGTRRPALPVAAPASAAPAPVSFAPQEVACYPTERDVCVRVLFPVPAPRTAQLTADGSSQVLATRTLGGRHERVRFTHLAPATRYRIELKDGEGHRVATVPFTTRGPEHAQWVERLTASMGDYLTMRFAVEEADILPDARLSAALARAVLKHTYDDATIVLACRLLDRIGEPVLAGTCRQLLTERLSPLKRAAVVHALARLGDERAEKLALAELETCTVPRATELYVDALVASALPGAFDAIARAAARTPEASIRVGRALVLLDASRVPALVAGWLSDRSMDAAGRARRRVASFALAYLGELSGWPDGALDDEVPRDALSALWFIARSEVSGARAALDSYHGPGRAMPEWAAVTAAFNAGKKAVTLESPTAEQRRLEAWRRGELEGPPDKAISVESSKWLAALLADPDPGVAELAAWRAGHIRDQSQRGALLARIGAHPESAGMAAWALARLGGPEAGAAVEHALERALAKEADPSVRAQLAWACGQLGARDALSTRRLEGQPAWLSAFGRAGVAWRTDPRGTTSYVVHSAVPYVRTGLVLEAGEGVEIDADTVRTPGRSGRTEPYLVPYAWAGPVELAGSAFPRVLVATRRAELVLSAWQVQSGVPRIAASEQTALMRFLVRR